jgi:hypothetical protein
MTLYWHLMQRLHNDFVGNAAMQQKHRSCGQLLGGASGKRANGHAPLRLQQKLPCHRYTLEEPAPCP